MTTEVLEYFSEQLEDWMEAIYFDLGISSKLTDRLEEVIRRNTIIDIAAKVEVYQKQLNDSERKLYSLEATINRQKKLLVEKQENLNNLEIDENIKQRQIQLGRKMKKVEVEFIRIKFDCNAFLYDVFNT